MTDKVVIINKTKRVSFPLFSIAIVLMIVGFIGEQGMDYNDELFSVMFTVGFWLFFIPLIIIGVIGLIIIIIIAVLS